MAWKLRCSRSSVLLACALLGCLSSQVLAQSRSGRRWHFSLEARANYRSSDDNRFRVGFPFGPGVLPPGQTNAFEETVDPGDHYRLSEVILETGFASPGFEAFLKLEGIDWHDRNPTSSDRAFDVDEAWLRFGRETETALLPDRSSGYVKVGKFGHFERQDDRHLESYGLVSTAFNRMEDVGVEAGYDLGRHFYVKAAYTNGNPLFLRDPNALAGDNGTPGLLDQPAHSEYNSGIAIPYDADVDHVDFENPQHALGLGLRFADASGRNGVELLAFERRRRLAQSVDLFNTFYGGDLDLLLGPTGAERPFAVTSDDKEEKGANLWLYLGGFSLFGQFVDQDLGGLQRTGIEAEVAWRFELPVFAGVRGRQLFGWIQPAVRFSKLDPDFTAPPQTPSPSFAWEWEKIDAGVRLGLVGKSDLTVEYARNRFVLGNGSTGQNDETLVTLRLRWGS